MTPSESPPILARIVPSAPRRLFGILALSVLGGLMLYLALARPPGSPGLQVFLLGLGAGGLALAEALRRSTARHLELTSEELRDSTGRTLARVDRIIAVDRGAFSVKPSNGFLLRLSAADEAGSYWAPGLWWRLGRRVGVGGITSAAEARAVADLLGRMIAAREAGDDSDP